MSATPARRTALRVLRAVRAGELADPALRRGLGELPARDRAWTQELVQGTLRLRGRLDTLLAAFSRRPLERLDPDVLDILRLGAYQLLEMNGVPAYAAVSQSVELAKPYGGAARLVNAVLQALGRGHADVAFPDAARDPVGYLSSWGSHPRWLVERWIERYGVDGAQALVDANNRRPELYLRPVTMSVADAAARLASAGHTAEPVGETGTLRLANGSVLTAALSAMPAIVQDPAAAIVVRYIAPPPNACIADLCAAPGGKSIALADAASPAFVVAGDVSEGRLRRLTENLRRLPPLRVGPVVMDARAPAIRPVDVVLLDAPCSVTGTLRRHPDARWRLGPDDIASLAALQAAMLEAAAQCVRDGGLLVYATCTLEPEENERQVEAFLNRHPDYRLEPPPGFDAALLDEQGQLRVLPHVHGFDGAFAARMRRAGDAG